MELLDGGSATIDPWWVGNQPVFEFGAPTNHSKRLETSSCANCAKPKSATATPLTSPRISVLSLTLLDVLATTLLAFRAIE
jgi:hypothetical protein